MKKNQHDEDLLKKIESLSKIRVEDEKKDEIISYINDIQKWFSVLALVDTSEVENSVSPISVFNNPDSVSCDNILTNKKTEHSYFVVPKIIDG